MAEDWNFFTETEICALRASGILIRKNKILLDHVMSFDEYWLPGGHVAIGETTESALHREWQEEFEQDCQIEKLAFVSENFRHWRSYQTNFIEFAYFLKDDGEISDDFHALTPDDADVEKVWVDLTDLSALTVAPQQLTELLTKVSDGLQHFVSTDK